MWNSLENFSLDSLLGTTGQVSSAVAMKLKSVDIQRPELDKTCSSRPSGLWTDGSELRPNQQLTDLFELLQDKTEAALSGQSVTSGGAQRRRLHAGEDLDSYYRPCGGRQRVRSRYDGLSAVLRIRTLIKGNRKILLAQRVFALLRRRPPLQMRLFKRVSASNPKPVGKI